MMCGTIISLAYITIHCTLVQFAALNMSFHFQAIGSLDRVWGKEALKRLIPEDLHLLANDWQRKIASEQLYRVLDAWHIWRSQVLSSQCSDDLVRVAVGTFTLNAHKSPCQKAVAACYEHDDKSTSVDVSKAAPLSLSQVYKAESPRGQPVELASPQTGLAKEAAPAIDKFLATYPDPEDRRAHWPFPARIGIITNWGANYEPGMPYNEWLAERTAEDPEDSEERPVSPKMHHMYHSGRWNKPASGYNPASVYRVCPPTTKWQEILDFHGLSQLGQSFDPPRSTSSRSSNDSWENLHSARSQSSQSWTNLDSPRSQSREHELVEPIPRRGFPKLVNKKVSKEDNSLASIKEVTEDPCI